MSLQSQSENDRKYITNPLNVRDNKMQIMYAFIFYLPDFSRNAIDKIQDKITEIDAMVCVFSHEYFFRYLNFMQKAQMLKILKI